MQEQNTNFFPTIVYILLKNIWAEKRYSLSNDIPPEKVKTNPIIEAKKIDALIAKNLGFSKVRIARKLRTSRARVTQMLNLLKLDPLIQEQVLLSKDAYTERQLRPLTRLKCFEKQRQLFNNMCLPVQKLKRTINAAIVSLPMYFIFVGTRLSIMPGISPVILPENCRITKSYLKQHTPIEKKLSPLAEALRYEDVLQEPSVETLSQVGMRFNVSRARVSQMLNLLNLDESIREYICSIDDAEKHNFLLKES